MIGFPKTFRVELSDGTYVFLIIKRYSINNVPTFFWSTDTFSSLGSDGLESELYLTYLECLLAMYAWIIETYKTFRVSQL